MLLVGAVALYGLVDYLFSGIDWTPLRVPVELEAGSHHAGSFVAMWGVRYELRLDTERALGLQEQNCRLGIETVVPEQCASIPSRLVLSWEVRSDSQLIASGVSRGTQAGYWGPTMGKILGGFEALEGRRYRVALTVERTATKLQRTDPHLEVLVAPRARKWTYVWQGLLIIAAACCLLFAVVLSLLVGRRSDSGHGGDPLDPAR